jgi:hypothetical protein
VAVPAKHEALEEVPAPIAQCSHRKVSVIADDITVDIRDLDASDVDAKLVQALLRPVGKEVDAGERIPFPG